MGGQVVGVGAIIHAEKSLAVTLLLTGLLIAFEMKEIYGKTSCPKELYIWMIVLLSLKCLDVCLLRCKPFV